MSLQVDIIPHSKKYPPHKIRLEGEESTTIYSENNFGVRVPMVDLQSRKVGGDIKFVDQNTIQIVHLPGFNGSYKMSSEFTVRLPGKNVKVTAL